MRTANVSNLPGQYVKCRLTDVGIQFVKLLDPSRARMEYESFKIRVPLDAVEKVGDEFVVTIQLSPKDFQEKLRVAALKEETPLTVSTVRESKFDMDYWMHQEEPNEDEYC